MPRTVLAFSGGIVSTTVLWDLLDAKHQIDLVWVNHGQAGHVRELQAVQDIYGMARQRDQATKLQILHVGYFPKLSEFGQYGLVVLTAALTYAATTLPEPAGVLAAGLSAERDGDLEYVITHLAAMLTRDKCGLYCPLKTLPVSRVVWHGTARRQGLSRQLAPISRAWSCRSAADAGADHCGACRGCRRRQAAFLGAGVADPTTYRSTLGKSHMPAAAETQSISRPIGRPKKPAFESSLIGVMSRRGDVQPSDDDQPGRELK